MCLFYRRQADAAVAVAAVHAVHAVAVVEHAVAAVHAVGHLAPAVHVVAAGQLGLVHAAEAVHAVGQLEQEAGRQLRVRVGVVCSVLDLTSSILHARKPEKKHIPTYT
jgi:hypothetical protein